MDDPTNSREIAAGRNTIYPLVFSSQRPTGAGEIYLRETGLRKLVEFFEKKGLRAIKEEDHRQEWYGDWIAFQAENGLYAGLLSPKEYSTRGNEFDLLRLARFLEVFAYFSTAHGYSLHVTFLGLFAVMMGSNVPLKKEAVAALERGELLAFGISEKDHGSDLLASEFRVTSVGPGRYFAGGRKYYIGNANTASMILILGRKEDGSASNRARRATPVLFALRPGESKGFGGLRKIETLGIRSAFVGEFEVKDHELPESDIIAEGRDAWEAVLGTVSLGKFFLGFGSIGICERAFEEAIGHLCGRVLFGKPVIEMPHIGAAIAQAYARLTAMKLYAYRALDYVHSATVEDRRYLLFTAVQKAKVSTEGVKVISLLSECIGAKAFEADTYFEMALREAQLIPSLEGSTHINLGMTAQFVPGYFNNPDRDLAMPSSLVRGECARRENSYLIQASGTQVGTVRFPPFRAAYRALWTIANVRIFSRQAEAFRIFARGRTSAGRAADTQISVSIGQCLASIAYGQLIAENAMRLAVPREIVSLIFHLLVNDLSSTAMTIASSRRVGAVGRALLERLIVIPSTPVGSWDFVLNRAKSRAG